MGLPTFDEGLHHIGLGPETNPDLYGFVLLGGYTRTGQRFGNDQDFGGQTDLIGTPTLSRWTQDDFSGGQYNYTFAKDAAMFSDSLGILPSQYDKSVRTVPPVVRVAVHTNGGRYPLLFFGYSGFIFSVFSNKVSRFDLQGGQHVDLLLDEGQNDGIISAQFDRERGELLLYTAGNPTQGFDQHLVRRTLPELAIPASTDGTGQLEFSQWAVPGKVTAFTMHASQIVAEVQGALWTLDRPDSVYVSVTSDQWKRVGRLPGRWRDCLTYNNQVYILVTDPDSGHTQVVTYDPVGAQVLPVADLPYNFNGRKLASYGGRVYVGGAGRDIEGNERFAELYEITGASLRLVRTFTPEYQSDYPSKPKTVYDLCVHEGLMFFSDTGRSLVAYDVTSDGFFGGPELENPDGVRLMTSIASYRSILWTYVIHPLDSSQDGLYRVATTVDGPHIEPYQATLCTADFAAEPDRLKRWSQMRVMTRNGVCSVGYSIDGGQPGGDTFEALPSTSVTNGDVTLTTVDLRSIPAAAHVRFRFTMPRGNDVFHYTELVAFTASFALLDTGKWTWNITVNAASRVEGVDGTPQIQNVHDIASELRRYWRDRVPLLYRDLDGETYTVYVHSFQESMPVISPPAAINDPGGLGVESGREAFFGVTLMEI